MIEYIRKARERCWKIYDQYYQEDKYKHHDARYREEIIQYLGPGTRLLDAGCGAKMAFTHEFATGTSMAVGMDIGELKPITGEDSYAVRGDLHSLPFKDGSFDIVISMSVIEHLSNPERAFRE